MKILHLVHSYPELSETFIKRFVAKSNKIGTTEVIAFNKGTSFQEQEILSVHYINRYFSRKTIIGAFKFLHQTVTSVPYWYNTLDQLLEKINPDIIHCHFGSMGVRYMEYKVQRKKINKPFITTFYGADASVEPKAYPEYRMKLQSLWEIGAGFFAEGPALAFKLQELGAPKDKIHINPLLIPTEEYAIKNTYRSKNDPIKFLMVGRFCEKKGFHLFLKAISNLKGQIPEFSITFIGYGNMENEYKKIITKYGFQEKVEFLGGRPHIEVKKFLTNHDFFVHPSLTAADGDSEGGAPTILLEAQTVGIPIITSDHADIPFIMGYNQFLNKEGSLNSLEECIKNAVHFDNWETLVKEGKKKVLEQHNFSNTPIYANLLKDIAK